MIDLILALWISISLCLAGVFTVSTITAGGFQEMCDRANMVAGKEVYTSNQIQWVMVLGTLFWPVYGIIGLFSIKFK